MTNSIWFVVPVHGRTSLAAICLRQLRRTCDALADAGIEATAVIVADRANLRALRKALRGVLGFGTIERDNAFLSRRFNDGIQLAVDHRLNRRPASFVVPCGSDDWVDWRLFVDLPPRNTIAAFQRMSFVREDGRELATASVDYLGGCGIRIYPRHVMAPLGFRPADEDRVRGCDTSILTNLRRVHGDRLRVVHRDSDPLQIVDWKSAGEQVNSYARVAQWHRGTDDDPFVALADVFPADALDDMRRHYGRARKAVPA